MIRVRWVSLGQVGVSMWNLGGKIQVGAEGSIGPVLLEPQDLYPNPCCTWEL